MGVGKWSAATGGAATAMVMAFRIVWTERRIIRGATDTPPAWRRSAFRPQDSWRADFVPGMRKRVVSKTRSGTDARSLLPPLSHFVQEKT